MRGLITVVVGVFALGLTAAIAAPVLLKPRDLEARVLGALSLAIDREVTVRGTVKPSVFPHVGVVVEGLEIANAPGFADPYLLRAERAEVRLNIGALMRGVADVAEVRLVRPDVRLERRDGRGNWVFKAKTGAVKRASTLVTRVQLVRLDHGRVQLRQDGALRRFDGVDLSWSGVAAMPETHLRARGRHNGQMFDLDVLLKASTKDGRPMTLKLSSVGARAQFSGLLHDAARLRFAGQGRVQADGLGALARLVGSPAPAVLPGQLVFQGSMTGADGGVGVHKAKISIGDVPMLASLSLRPALGRQTRPQLSGVVDVAALDLTPYAPEGSGPAVAKGADGVAPWPTTPMDWSVFRAFDWAVTLQAREGVQLHRLHSGPARVSVVSDGRAAILRGEGRDVYGGQGTVQLRVALGTVPDVALSAQLNGVDAPRLLAAFGYDRIRAGQLTAGLDVTGRGTTQAAVMASLDGRGQFTLTDADIRGPAFSRMARKTAQIIRRRSLDDTGSTQTVYDHAAAHWTVADGQVAAPDVMLKARDFSVIGDAAIDLPGQTLAAALVVQPRPGPPLPLRISGPWGRSRVKLDLLALGRTVVRTPLDTTRDWVHRLLSSEDSSPVPETTP